VAVHLRGVGGVAVRPAVAVALLAAVDASAAAGGDVASHQKATRSPRVDPEVPGSRSPTTTVLAVLAEVVAHEQTVQPKGAVGGELGASNADTDRRAGERRVDGIASAADVPGLNVHDHAPAQRLPDQLEPLTASADTSTRVLIYHFGTRDGLLREVLRAARQRQSLPSHLIRLRPYEPRLAREQRRSRPLGSHCPRGNSWALTMDLPPLSPGTPRLPAWLPTASHSMTCVRLSVA
jgi:hypothetical protein